MPFGRKRTGGYGAGKRKRLQNLQLARDKKISRDESVATTSSATVTTPTRMAGGVSSYACFILPMLTEHMITMFSPNI